MADKELIEAWYRIIQSMTDDLAACSLAILVLVETFIRRGEEEHRLWSSLRPFRHIHLQYALRTVCPEIKSDKINRMTKTQMVRALIEHERQQQKAITEATKGE